MAESFHATALSWIQELEVLVIDLRQAGGLPLCEPQKTKGIYPSSGILIEELSPDTAAKAQERQLQEQLISNSCLVVALYAADSVLLTPWTTHQLGIASRDLLQALAPSGLLAVAENMLQGVAGQQQPTHEQFLVSALPHLLSHFKLCFNHDVYQYEKAQVPKESGPDAFTRCLAARQLAFLVRQLGYQQLGTILPAALPCVLATVKDQSPAVQCYGLHALRHISEEVLSADLKPHQQQLMTVAAESLVGCDDAVWTVAAPTACAILCSMGSSCQGPGHQEVMRELLRQAEKQCHKKVRRLAWLEAIKPVFAVLGLQTLRFFSKLMPLLLNWCQEPDLATQLKALEVLQEIVRHTWPRMPAHASFLWTFLANVRHV
ncbi:MAG: hypothetical protein FRX49_05188 [Trebouxia sp. A1-2]|nr:MAG: hypothetical protein FRX49_05188 [Trebouxia sp. A1-2]